MTSKRKLPKLMIRTPVYILIYCSLSITLTFYNKWFINNFHFPLTVTLIHLTVKFLISGILRLVLTCISSKPRVTVSWDVFVQRIAPTGIASSFDIGLSNWSFQFITVSLYTMTKSTCIIFILFFSIIFKLEKPKWSLAVIVIFIFSGLFMFTFKTTQFSVSGFLLVLVASFLGGLRWTLAQIVTQKQEIGLSHPVDMVFHIQPWMALSLLPLVAVFEGERAMVSPCLFGFHDPSLLLHYVTLMMVGGFLALVMELAEYLLLQTTSSLTLSISGIGKEIVTLVLDTRINGTRLTSLNTLGLCVCLSGIALHVYHKWEASSSAVALSRVSLSEEEGDDDGDDDDGKTVNWKGGRGEAGGGGSWIELAEVKSWERKRNISWGGEDEGIVGGGGGSQLKVPLLLARN